MIINIIALFIYLFIYLFIALFNEPYSAMFCLTLFFASDGKPYNKGSHNNLVTNQKVSMVNALQQK